MLAKIKSAVQDRVLSEVLVYCRTSFATNVNAYEPGRYYRLPAGKAKDYARAGFVRIVDDPAELLEAEAQVSRAQEIY